MNGVAAQPAVEAVMIPPGHSRMETVSVAAHAARGAFWNILFSVLNKAVAFTCQLGLAWFLLPADMGLAGIALSIASIVSIVSGTNLAMLLSQTKDDFEENAREIFWLALTLNGTAALLLVLFAPVAGHLFHETRLVPLILILALAVPWMALPTIYSSYLYRELRFRVLAQIQFGEGVIRNVGGVVLAALGFGAYSLVLPQPVGTFYGAVSYRALAGNIPMGRPHPRRWPALLTPIAWLMLVALVSALQTSGTIFLIGLIRNPTVTGFYAWGFALSSQAIFLLGHNLQGVFLPVLSQLGHDARRQNQAFAKACKILALIVAPVCALQIVLAYPLIELLFHERWLPAAPVVQWLSVGMMTQPLSILGSSLLLARGRYRLLALLSAGLMALLTAAAIAGAWWGGAAEIARCTGLTLFCTNLITGWVACREFHSGSTYFFTRLVPPLLVAFPLLALGEFLTSLTRHHSPFVTIATTSVLLTALYLGAIRLWDPPLIQQLAALFSRRNQRAN
jgi:O-antigen/teichoic acid export membrane protein